MHAQWLWLLNKIKEKRKQLTFKLVVFEIITMITAQIYKHHHIDKINPIAAVSSSTKSFFPASSLSDLITVRVHFSFSLWFEAQRQHSLTVEARTKG